MRLIAFITEGTQIRKILDHIRVDSEPPHISPARGPPVWDDCDAHVGEEGSGDATGTPPLTAAGFVSATGSYANGTGSAAGVVHVFSDFSGNAFQGAMDMGAFRTYP